MAIESKAMLRYARISPRKARVVVNLVRGTKVSQALEVLAFTRKSGAPIVKKLIESALSNAKQADNGVDVDALFVTTAMVDKGPAKNMRRYRPRAMGRATQITRGVSHIQIVLTDTTPALKGRKAAQAAKAGKLAERRAAKGAAPAATSTTTTTAE